MKKPLIVVDPLPRTLGLICDGPTRARLEGLGQVIAHEEAPMPDELVERYLPDAAIWIGQTRMDEQRLQRAKKLKAIINVETNFTDAIDYEFCFRAGIHVLAPASAFADVVAESALAMAIDLARGITAADRAFRSGREAYGLDGNAGCFQLAGSPVGLIGFGDLARSLHRLIQPFNCPIKVYDPWVPDYVIHRHGCTPASLPEVLIRVASDFRFRRGDQREPGVSRPQGT